MTTLSQRTFSSGEISPSLYARVDLVKYATGLRTCKNNIVLRYGGAANRPGTLFVGEASDSSKTIRLIPFIFNNAQTYVLEFGENYMRVIKDSAYLTESAVTITGVTQANPGVVTATAHGYSNGDEVYIAGVVGMSEINGRNFKVANKTANTFELQDMTSTDLDTTTYTAYSSGGSSYKIYEIVTTYQEAELSTLKFVQSADIITLVHPNHPPREIARSGDTTWTLTDISFLPTVEKPDALALAIGGAGGNTYKYKVTSIDAETGEESLPGVQTATIAITGVTQADPAVVTVTAHGLSSDEEVYINNVVGMTELNLRHFSVTVLTANTFELNDEDSTNFTAYSSSGAIQKAFVRSTAAAAPTSGAPHVVSWARISGAREYNIYKETNGVYGQIGIANGTSFSDINITPNTSFTPPDSRNPFIGAGNYPSTVTYIQQRLGFANTDNNTEKVYLSRTANFKNFTTSSPSQDDDAITFNMVGRQVNEVESLLDLGRLVILTSGGEWTAGGDSAGVISPSNINTKQYSYNGSGSLQPITIDGAALYQQARGSIIRDLSYNFEVDGYTGNDLTIFSSHLFDKYSLVDWAYQQIPHNILWVVRSDGVLLGLTFVRNQEVIAWHRHDLGGLVENVTVIPEGNEDALYVTVKRTINGTSRRYVEKLTSRQISNIVDNKFMDSHLSYDGRNAAATTMTLSGGTNWTFDETLTLTASTAFFAATDVGNAIHLRGASSELIRATITAYTSTTVVSVSPHKTVPADLRATATTDWDKAVDQVGGLWHLEGETVSIFADGFVVGSPNNASYSTYTVASGIVTLDKPYAVIHVGIPYLSDIETLDIDLPSGETLADKEKIVGEVNCFVEETRGVFTGPKPPSNDAVDPLENLVEFKIRDAEDYDSPVSLTTDVINVNIKAEWNSNGRVFIRQVDPIPMTILSINPAGKFPLG